jgi:hypothetical protein
MRRAARRGRDLRTSRLEDCGPPQEAAPPRQGGHVGEPTKTGRDGWLEELDVGRINAPIKERKSYVIQNYIAVGTQKNRVTAMTQFVEFFEVRQTSPIHSAGLVRNMTPAEVAANENLLVYFSVHESWRVTPGA